MAVRPLPDVPAGSYGPEVLNPGIVYEDNWKESKNQHKQFGTKFNGYFEFQRRNGEWMRFEVADRLAMMTPTHVDADAEWTGGRRVCIYEWLHPGVEVEEARAAKVPVSPKLPSKKEVEQHNVTHLPRRPWCSFCVRGAGIANPHVSQECDQRIATVSCDYF